MDRICCHGVFYIFYNNDNNRNIRTMNLVDCETGKWYEVKSTELIGQNVRMRLAHLGLTGKLKVIKRQGNSGPVIVKIKGAKWTLSNDLARKINLKEVEKK